MACQMRGFYSNSSATVKAFFMEVARGYKLNAGTGGVIASVGVGYVAESPRGCSEEHCHRSEIKDHLISR